MNTLQIDRKLKNENGYLGAYAFDILPRSKRKQFSLVINTASHREEGEHWLCLIYKDNTFYFMDSYGRNFTHFTFSTEFRTTIARYIGNRKCRFNKEMLQGLTSNCCGLYAIFFIKMLNRNKTMRQIASYFTGNTHLNDRNIITYVNKLM